MSVSKIISEYEAKMAKAAESLHNELKAVRTGRASTGLVDNIKVEYYGTLTPLKQLATLATPQADMIVIKPFDPSSIKEIERAIKKSDLSIAPVVDGQMIRLNVPPLSADRRQQIVKQVKQLGEQAKIAVRNIRRDIMKHIEKEEEAKLITEDDLKKGEKQADDVVKKYSDKVDSMVKSKSDEIMQG